MSTRAPASRPRDSSEDSRARAPRPGTYATTHGDAALWCGVLIAAFCAVTLSGQQSATPSAFRYERPIVVGGPGPRRLAIDVPLLVGAAPFRVIARTRDPKTDRVFVGLEDGLRDLRLYDASGAEVGYLLMGYTPPEPTYKAAVILPVASVDTDTAKTSGFEADLGELTLIDRFRIDGLRPPFLKRVKLEASGDREHWTVLVPEGTLFDLPDESLLQTELRFAPGSFRYLRITWDDTNSGRLPRPPAVFAGTIAHNTPPAPPLTAPLAFERRPSEPGRSRFRIRLPGGRLPIAALDLDVGGGHILREAGVFQAQLSGTQLAPVRLGQITLARVVRGALTASALRIPMEPPTESQLDLVVADGDNPPFDLRGVTAVFVGLPWIYVEPAGSALTARYGNSTLTAPRYDLEATRDQIRIESVADAAWGEPRARTAEENAGGATPPLPTVGAAVDPGLFRYIRTVPEGGPGLIALSLDAGVLAHSAGPSGQFGDLRVVDNADRQIPYIVEQASEPLSLDVTIERLAKAPQTLPPARSGRSVFRVKYPVDGLPEARLVLTTSARVFERTVSLAEEREPDRDRRRDAWLDTIATTRWVHADQDKPATPLTLPVRQLRATDALVIVDEGDNTPLPIEGARLLLPAYRIRLFRGTGAHLRVAYGRTDLERPQYDLALLAPQVLGAPAADVALDPERPVAPGKTTASIVSPRLFWGALVLAVIVLLGLIARLLKKESAG
jgi:hypothetical protein